MNIAQIETKLKNSVEYFNQFEFIYELLEAYNLPKASITRLRKGNLNLSKNQDEIIWKKKLHFKEEFMFDLHETIIALKGKIKHGERFIIVTDYKTILAIDTVTEDKLDCKLQDLPKHYDFFLPWAGMEKTTHANENPADVKAAERMAKLFDEIKKENHDDSPEFLHSLNVLLSRLLFCFFAEDTNIFEEGQFTNTLSSHTSSDGSDLDEYLSLLFEVLNTPVNKRKDVPRFLESFPYVNGGLFKDKIITPRFNRKSRQAIIDSGELVWSAINPDIFGSMFQAVISVDQRGSLGQHYTSVPNIMKVIEPLFLNELREEFEKARGNVKKLNDLTKRIQNIKVFDSACGSGNFLIIAYKELRKLEIEIFTEIDRAQGTYTAQFSLITLNNFYGIELDDFAHEIAKLALWLAEHQMNMEFFQAFGKTNPTLPLKDAGQITCGNACRLDWEKVCPRKEGEEVYILGNPPYLGTRNQDKEQKSDIDYVFKTFSKRRKLDYISIWFYLASKYCDGTNASYAFVTTNSICQGEQVPILWPIVLKDNKEISFAHTSFKWTNNAKGNAGVTVVIIGISNKGRKGVKQLFTNNILHTVDNINPYLAPGKTIYIEGRNKPISKLAEMVRGNYTGCCNSLILSDDERDSIVEKFPDSKFLFRRLIGSDELINSKERYCLWISDSQLDVANSFPPIKERIEIVRNTRSESTDLGQQKLANRPHQFREFNEPKGTSIIVPVVSSERREYVPAGFAIDNSIIPNSAQVIYNCEPYYFGLICSRIHNLWMRALAGRLENRIRYSSSICYNTFPFPDISSNRKEEITQSVMRIIEAREQYSDKTLAELYDSDSMPKELRDAHIQNDLIIEKCYRVTPFKNDEERLEYLFKLYEKMSLEEQSANTLFEIQKKTRKKK